MSIIKKFPFEWQIGVRYTRAGKRSARNSFISFISLISVAGIGLGVAALIVVLSVMNGFQKEVTDRLMSVLAHVEVFDTRGAMPDWQDQVKAAFANPAVRGAAPFVETQGMLLHDDTMRPSGIRGVLPQEEPKVSSVAAQVKQGSFDDLKPGAFHIVLGVDLARALDVTVGKNVTLLLQREPEPGQPASTLLPRMRAFTVVGIFEAGHNELDSRLAFIHMNDAESLLHLAGPSGLRLKLADMDRAPQVARELKASMPGDLWMRDWSRVSASWYALVQSQKNMMFIILSMIIAVAAFNLVSTLVMSVTDKQADIAILRTLGASPASIMKIFMIQGALVGLLGSALGVAGGVVLALNVGSIVPVIEHLLGMHFLSKEIYQISTVPSDVHWLDVLHIGLIAFALSLVATIYPSWRAARVKPAEALRYE
ncbi:lipoprotein-releasing ABC transporter permease subunit [Janthinobacterium agaricidamnosum]|uniref:Liporeleasing system, transmembrane, LolC/E family protein n=1 Tax=Janthinobacterium agaricidamnosum NBRC 102515 = DSM 9628 TaxID=1349767 RepID=W0V638_9BURK|nr:lipoprotein-releasing ABC transporter permease subunit [Janthinobacterium agaricidamnosum]CDG82818.1 liporeleasing system, transmembrane, LolC/E family protein [Janthinobacterium agaricidamnosum NBRC 102515 = DSM 9628]